MESYSSPAIISTSAHLAEVKAVYKSQIKITEQPQFNRSQDIRDYFFSIWDHDQIEFIEQMFVIFLNRQNRVLGWAKVSSGGHSGTVGDAKVIFSMALVAKASQIALAHNHPSGHTKPSGQDIRLTHCLTKAGKMLDLPLIDHLILTADKDTYYSFADDCTLEEDRVN